MISLLKKLDEKYPSLLVFFVVFLFSCLLILPQLLDKGSVLGADFLFHYNRFYEAAMQIKEGNYSYFISIYGFQESGRIINALYGPFFAYFQGLLVLISGTWFRYQLLSKVVLGVIAGLSLDQLLTVANVKRGFRVPLSLIFITTYSVQYWWLVQGFSSWGAALFPLCFIPAVKVLQTGKIDKFYLGGAVALMAQVHVLSTFFLVLSYLPCFFYSWLKSEQKWHFVKEGLLAVGIYALLTPNVLFPLVDLYANNQLKAPFVNRYLAKSAITWQKWMYLITPFPLLMILIGNLIGIAKTFKTSSAVFQLVTITYLLFLLLSTNLFPWQLFEGKGVAIIDLIQFPFRFFFYGISLLLLLVGIQLTEISGYWQKKLMTGLFFIVVVAGFQTTSVTSTITTQFYQGIYPEERHTTRFASEEAIKSSFHDENLSRLLLLMQKSTPDYVPKKSVKSANVLPIPEGKNYYHMYTDYIILNQERVSKRRQGSNLHLTWTASEGEKLLLPIVVYKGSHLVFNGSDIDHDTLTTTAIGNPVVVSKEGKNTLILSYETPKWLLPTILFTFGSWAVYIFFLLRQFLIKK